MCRSWSPNTLLVAPLKNSLDIPQTVKHWRSHTAQQFHFLVCIYIYHQENSRRMSTEKVVRECL